MEYSELNFKLRASSTRPRDQFDQILISADSFSIEYSDRLNKLRKDREKLMSNISHIIQKAHAMNVGNHLANHSTAAADSNPSSSYVGAANYASGGGSRQPQLSYQFRKSPANPSARTSIGASDFSGRASASLPGTGSKPSTASANARRRAQIKQLLMMPRSTFGSHGQGNVGKRVASLSHEAAMATSTVSKF